MLPRLMLQVRELGATFQPNQSSSPTKHHRLPIGAIVGGGVAALFFISLCIAILYLGLRKRSSKKDQRLRKQPHARQTSQGTSRESLAWLTIPGKDRISDEESDGAMSRDSLKGGQSSPSSLSSRRAETDSRAAGRDSEAQTPVGEFVPKPWTRTPTLASLPRVYSFHPNLPMVSVEDWSLRQSQLELNSLSRSSSIYSRRSAESVSPPTTPSDHSSEHGLPSYRELVLNTVPRSQGEQDLSDAQVEQTAGTQRKSSTRRISQWLFEPIS